MKKTLKCFIHYSTESWNPGVLSVYGCDVSHLKGMACVLVKEFDVDFEIPDNFDPRPAQIASLQDANKKAAADFHALQTEIMRQINELQAVEMTV